MRRLLVIALACLAVVVLSRSGQAQPEERAQRAGKRHSGKHLFERETFGGNGRTCLTCHSRETGTVSSADAWQRFIANTADPLFLHDGSETLVRSPDSGRALITGVAQSHIFDSANAFKIPSLWGVRRTAPYCHDNSAKTLEDVVAHYARFFALISTPRGGGEPVLVLTEQDQADIVAFMKLLD